MSVIPNALDTTRFTPTWSVRRRETAQPQIPILLWIGRLEHEKNPAGFINLGLALLERRAKMRFTIVGDAFDDETYVSYRDALVEGIPLQHRERFEWVRSVSYSRMPELYQAVASSGGALVSTSRWESVPMVMLEAMASGCPVVSFQVGGIQEIAHNGTTAVLVPPGDYEAAISAIDTLTHVNQFRETLIRAAREYVESTHSLQAVGERCEALFQAAVRPSVPACSAEEQGLDGRPVCRGMVSVIIPVFNRAAMLVEAVESVLAQTYSNIEIIIVDDGSTDQTATVVDDLATRYRSVRVVHGCHVGRAGLVREAGRQLARGEYIQYLDSDDLLDPDKFSKIVALLESHPECDVAYCRTRRYTVGHRSDFVAERTGVPYERMFPEFISRRFWCTSTPIYRRTLCDRRGPWSDLLFWEDVEYDVGVASLNPRLAYCEDCLTDFRDHDEGRLSGTHFMDDPALLHEAVRGATRIAGWLSNAGVDKEDEHFRCFVDDVRVLHKRCGELGLSEDQRACADMYLQLMPDEDRDAIDGFSVAVALRAHAEVMRWKPGQSVRLPIVIENRGTLSLHAGDLPSELAYSIRRADGSSIARHASRSVIDPPLSAGKTREYELWLDVPNAVGVYYFEVDLLWGRSAAGPQPIASLLLKALVSDGHEQEWLLRLVDQNQATILSSPSKADELQLDMACAEAKTPWHVQVQRSEGTLVAGEEYSLSFDVRASTEMIIGFGVGMNHTPWESLGLYQTIDISTAWTSQRYVFRPPADEEQARLHFDCGGNEGVLEIRNLLMSGPGRRDVFEIPHARRDRLGMDHGIAPISAVWGTDLGLPVHRYYLDQFLARHSHDIRGRCLEFQDSVYTRRHGADRVASIEVIHIDESNPLATIVADLTKPNDLAAEQFDTIVCTHVLHVVEDPGKALREMYRLLRPGGILLIAVPHVSMYEPEYGELWRFTPEGLARLLSDAFGRSNVAVVGYGNSLTAAGEIRGIVSAAFSSSELDTHDHRFPVEVCGRAFKIAAEN